MFFHKAIFCLIILNRLIVASQKNVLMIVVDDLRTSLSCLGDLLACSPNIDRLAHSSVVFSRAYAQQALCAPSRNSFLTSRRPDATRLYDFYSYWRESAGNFTTLPQYFRERGYLSASFGKVFHPGISSNYTDDWPYSWSLPPYHPPAEEYKNARVCPDEDGSLHRNLVCPVSVDDQPMSSLPDIQTVQKANEFLRGIRYYDKPFFLAVGFHKPHIPLKYPKKYVDILDRDKFLPPSNAKRPIDLPDIAWNPWMDVKEREDIGRLNITFPYGQMDDNWSKLIRLNYYAAVSYTDDQIGLLLQQLSDSGFWNDTIILLLGDHGWSLGEHGEWSKFSNYDVALNVPLIVRVPKLTGDSVDFRRRDNLRDGCARVDGPGVRSRRLVELVDLFPTLVDLAQLQPLRRCPRDSSGIRACTQGASIAPYLQHLSCSLNAAGGRRRRRGCGRVRYDRKKYALSQYPRPSVEPRTDSDKPRLRHIRFMGYSLKAKNYRFTVWVPFDWKTFKANWNKPVSYEYYNHLYDPQENHNLIQHVSKPTIKILIKLVKKQFES